MTASRPYIATSVRFVIAMMRLYAGIEAQFGKALLDILRKQYPDQEITESDSAVGHKLMAIARKELQGNETDAMDAIQRLLMYLTTGSTSSEVKYDDGKPIKKEWDFKKDWPTWQEALRAAYSNLRTTAMSGSMTKMNRKKKERSIDDAFGTRGEDGGAKSEGEARMPTPDDTAIGKALDDKAAAKEFFDVIEDWIPDLRQSLSEDELKLFDLIMEDEVGSFGSDVNENMGQASALKDKHPELYEKNAKRWSGFVGDLRKKLLEKITKFVEEELPESAYDTLYDIADVNPIHAERAEAKKEQGKKDYQKGIDERKVARLKAEYDDPDTDPDRKEKIKEEIDRIAKKGIDVDSIKPDAAAGAGKKKKKQPSAAASVLSMAARIAARPVLRSYGV